MSTSASTTKGASTGFWLRVIAVVLLGLSLLRLNAWVEAIGSSSIQMDLAAFYTAGQSLNFGYSPYENNIDKRPQAWDGLSAYRHSRFLYPPLVATLFRPLAALSYPAAKMAWMVVGLGSLLGSLLLVRRLAGLASLDSFLFCCAGAASFHPLLCNLERGQIDLVTLLLLVCGISALADGRRPAGLAGGALFALVTLLKLHAVLLVPFLILRRRWDALAGMLVGGLLLGALTLALNGRGAIDDYLHVQLPRIAEFGEGGPESMLMPVDVLRANVDPSGRIVKDGAPYVMEVLNFFPNATLVRPLGQGAVDAGLSPRLSMLSLGLYSVGFVGVALAMGLRAPGPRPPAREELVYWLTAMALVMLTSPLTWTMNVVWLIPALPISLALFVRPDARGTVIGASVLLMAFLIAWVPDTRFFPILRPLALADEAKYIAAEFLAIAAGAYLVRRSMAARAANATAPVLR